MLLIQGIKDCQTTDPGNGPAQSHKLRSVQLIGSAEVVDNFSNWLSCNGVSFVVGQLVVFNTEPSLFFRLVVRKYMLT